MKKLFKTVGLFILILIGLALLFIILFWGGLEWSNYSKKKEAIRYQKEVCDTIRTVNRKFQFTLSGFSKMEMKQVHFYLIQDKLIKQDSVVNVNVKPDTEYQDLMLPFNKIRITDKVIVKVGNRSFLLSGLNYTAKYHYGMFGPVGDCECMMDGFEKINGESAASAWLVKKYGLSNYQLPPRLRP